MAYVGGRTAHSCHFSFEFENHALRTFFTNTWHFFDCTNIFLRNSAR